MALELPQFCRQALFFLNINNVLIASQRTANDFYKIAEIADGWHYSHTVCFISSCYNNNTKDMTEIYYRS